MAGENLVGEAEIRAGHGIRGRGDLRSTSQSTSATTTTTTTLSSGSTWFIWSIFSLFFMSVLALAGGDHGHIPHVPRGTLANKPLALHDAQLKNL